MTRRRHAGFGADFFPWKDLPNGRDGTGEVSAVAFAMDEAGLGYWQSRLIEEGLEVRGPMDRFGEACLKFEDPDGFPLEIVVADQTNAFQPWAKSSQVIAR